MHSFQTVMVIGFALLATAAGQNPAETATFKSRTDLVLVPVVVHDKEGKHVSGLKAEDFTLEDNGAKQKIASAEEIAPDKSVPGPPVELREDVQRGVLFTNQLAKPTQPKELTIFAIDLVNAPFVDTEQGRRAMLGFVAAHMSSNRTMGLVAIEAGRVRLLHAFTTSPTILSAALGKVTAVTSAPATQSVAEVEVEALRDQQASVLSETTSLAGFIAAQRAQASQAFLAATAARNDQNIATALESLRLIASWVAGIPGRKVLVWMTGDIPFITGQGTTALGRIGAADYERTMNALADANVAVYPVDVRGVVPESMYSSRYIDPNRQQQQTIATSMDASPAGIRNRSEALQRGVVHSSDSHEAMNYLANLTGGRAYYNQNNIPRVLDDAAADSERYYVLSYYLDRSRAKPGWHKLKVSVSRQGVTERARNGFVVPKPGNEDAPSVKQSEERLALASPFDYTGLPVTLRWTDVQPKGDKRKVSFQVVIPPSATLVSDQQKAVDLDFIAVASEGTGEMAGNSSRTFRGTLKPEAVQQIQTYGLTYVSDLEVKPGQYVVRLVVRDNLTGRLGTISAPLKVAP